MPPTPASSGKSPIIAFDRAEEPEGIVLSTGGGQRLMTTAQEFGQLIVTFVAELRGRFLPNHEHCAPTCIAVSSAKHFHQAGLESLRFQKALESSPTA